MATEHEVETQDNATEVEGVEFDGRTYASWEEAREAMLEFKRGYQRKFDDLATQRKAFERQQDEMQQPRTAPTPANGEWRPTYDPSTHPQEYVSEMIDHKLQQVLMPRDAALRQVMSDVALARAASSGVNLDKVKDRVRAKWSHKPDKLALILSDPEMLAEQQKLMEAEEAAADLATLRQQREAKKRRSTTESGAAGQSGSGIQVPTPRELAALSTNDPAKYDKIIQRAKDDPAYAEALMNQ